MKTSRMVAAIMLLVVSVHVAHAQWEIDPGNPQVTRNVNQSGAIRIFTSFNTPTSAYWPFFVWGNASHPSGTTAFVGGANLLALNSGAGTATLTTGAYVTTGNESSGTGTITTAYAIKARVQTGLGTINTGYGVYIENTAAVSDWGLYQAGTDDTNYFAGNVGVGTTNPGSFKLAVEGKIGAREVQVLTTNPFPDYVFESDYKLPPLAEIEAFIKKNKHLPEIPSAEEVKENGIALGDLSTRLVKKIEELTLYVLALEKKTNDQSDQIKKLQEELNALKKD